MQLPGSWTFGLRCDPGSASCKPTVKVANFTFEKISRVGGVAGSMVAIEITEDIRLGLEAASEARSHLERLEGAIPERKLQELSLMVSELITNSVKHSGGPDSEPVSLRVTAGDGLVRAEVYDHGFGFEKPSTINPSGQVGGKGLYIVDTLSERWDVFREGSRFCVWLELRW